MATIQTSLRSRRASPAIAFSVPVAVGIGFLCCAVALAVSLSAQVRIDRLSFLWPVHMLVLANLSLVWGTEIMPRGRAVWWLAGAQVGLLAAAIVDVHGWSGGWSIYWAVINVGIALGLGVLLRWALRNQWFPVTPRDLLFGLISILAAAITVVVTGATPLHVPVDLGLANDVTFILLIFVQNAVGLLVLALMHYPAVREPLTNSPHLPWQIAGIILLSVGATALPAFVSDLPPVWTLLIPSLWAGLVLRYRQALALMAFTMVLVLFSTYGLATMTGVNNGVTYGAFVQTLAVLVGSKTLVLVMLRQMREEAVIVLRRERSAARAEAAVQSTVLEAMSEGLVLVDQDGDVLFRNEAAVQLLGREWPRDRPASWISYFGLLTPDGDRPLDEREEHRMRAVSDQTIETLHAALPDKNTGDQRDLLITTRTVGGASFPRRLLLIRDITEQQQRQEQLLGFAQTVAHDLKSPMAGIDMWMNRLETALANDDLVAGRQSVEWLNRGSARLRRVIDDWLAFTVTRHSELQPVPLSLLQLVEQTLDGATDVSPDRIPIVELDLAHRVKADEHITRQLLANLLHNALKYTPTDRRPHLRITSREGDEGWVIVEVSDRGRGIPITEQEAVFREYMRSNRDAAVADGHGIGLALCREAVERHGGWIRATSNPHGGATLVFALPLA